MAATFQAKKQKILKQLEIPDEDYTDLSPKGSVDEGVRELVGVINKHDGFVTTSSCAGRVAVYLEGISKRARQEDDQENEPSGIASGGKGGGQWLYVSHDPPSLVSSEQDGAVCSLLNLPEKDELSSPTSSENVRFVRLKFEPLVRQILHAFTCYFLLVCNAEMHFSTYRSSTSSPPLFPTPKKPFPQRSHQASARAASAPSHPTAML